MEDKNRGLLPDYEKLFAEEAEHRRDGALVITRLLKQNSFKILLSAVMFAIKDSIGIIAPIVTANIINALVYPEDGLRSIIIKNAILLVVLYILHIPGHAIYSKYVFFLENSVFSLKLL